MRPSARCPAAARRRPVPVPPPMATRAARNDSRITAGRRARCDLAMAAASLSAVPGHSRAAAMFSRRRCPAAFGRCHASGAGSCLQTYYYFIAGKKVCVLPRFRRDDTPPPGTPSEGPARPGAAWRCGALSSSSRRIAGDSRRFASRGVSFVVPARGGDFRRGSVRAWTCRLSGCRRCRARRGGDVRPAARGAFCSPQAAFSRRRGVLLSPGVPPICAI